MSITKAFRQLSQALKENRLPGPVHVWVEPDVLWRLQTELGRPLSMSDKIEFDDGVHIEVSMS